MVVLVVGIDVVAVVTCLGRGDECGCGHGSVGGDGCVGCYGHSYIVEGDGDGGSVGNGGDGGY